MSRRTLAGNRCFWSESYRRVFATDIDAELGLITCVRVGSARWPDGPPQSRVAHWFCLFLASGGGVVVDGRKTEGTLT